MGKIKLDNDLLEDLGMDLLPCVEKYFNFEFDDEELLHVFTVEELVTIIISKVETFDEDEFCTSQQAFYKIRTAISEMQVGEPLTILPSSDLENIFPEKNRLKTVCLFEKKLGVKLDILEPNEYIASAIIILGMLSFIFLFFNQTVGLSGLFVSVILNKIVYRFGKNLKYKNIRDFIENTVCENYLFYKGGKFVNKNELRGVLFTWFADRLDIEREQIRNVYWS